MRVAGCGISSDCCAILVICSTLLCEKTQRKPTTLPVGVSIIILGVFIQVYLLFHKVNSVFLISIIIIIITIITTNTSSSRAQASLCLFCLNDFFRCLHLFLGRAMFLFLSECIYTLTWEGVFRFFLYNDTCYPQLFNLNFMYNISLLLLCLPLWPYVVHSVTGINISFTISQFSFFHAVLIIPEFPKKNS